MSLSRLPLSYCTNVHPGRSAGEVEDGLDRYAVQVSRILDKPLAAGLWLAQPVVSELLSEPDAVRRFVEGVRGRGLSCHTLNAFPFGDFHSERVKEQVYLPDWTQAQRLAYTEQCAMVLAEMLVDGTEGSISTVPLGFKGFKQPGDFEQRCMGKLIDCARTLARLRERTGKLIRLAIEPEPLCVLETTAEAIEFFAKLWQAADQSGDGETARTHLGLCYDVCHQAVEFEQAGASIAALDRAGVRINKVHVSCALQLHDPANNAEGRAALKRYVEPRYLHQTLARSESGQIVRAVDLTEKLVDEPGPELAAAPTWRIHFHVPVNAERLGPLDTTRGALLDALPAVAKLDYAPHLEVETYTWEVLPGARQADLVEGLTRELLATEDLLRTVSAGRMDQA